MMRLVHCGNSRTLSVSLLTLEVGGRGEMCQSGPKPCHPPFIPLSHTLWLALLCGYGGVFVFSKKRRKKSHVGCRLSLRCNYCPIPSLNLVVGFALTLFNTSKFLNVSCIFIIDEFATLLALQCILNFAALIAPQEADHRSQIMCACVLVLYHRCPNYSTKRL